MEAMSRTSKAAVRAFALLALLLLCGTASAQVPAPFGFWKSGAVAYAVPTDSLDLWLDASTITGKVSGDTIGIWPPVYGTNAYSLVAAQKPVYYSDSLGGKPGISFDGTDDRMLVDAGTVGASKYRTVIVVAKTRKPKTTQILVEQFTGFEALAANIYDPSSQDSALINASIGSVGGGTSAIVERGVQRSLSPFVCSSMADGSVTNVAMQALYVNSDTSYYRTQSNRSAGDAPSFEIHIAHRSAAALYSDCVIAEVLFYTRLLTYTELRTLHNYIAVKYGITASLPMP